VPLPQPVGGDGRQTTIARPQLDSAVKRIHENSTSDVELAVGAHASDTPAGGRAISRSVARPERGYHSRDLRNAR